MRQDMKSRYVGSEDCARTWTCCFLAWVMVVAVSLPAAAAEVELDYRLQPGQDLTAEAVTETVSVIRVVEDRGIVAMSQGRLSARAVTLQIQDTQSIRYLTGERQADNSFPVEMQYLGKSTRLTGIDGSAQVLPEKLPLVGLKVRAIIGATGRLQDGSVVLTGPGTAVTDPIRQMMAAVLAQAAAIEPITLHPDRSVPQNVQMQLPLPGVEGGALTINMHIQNRLLGVDRGVARIQQIFSMDFGVPAGVMALNAQGSGGGTMLYEMTTRTLLSNRSTSLMKLVLDAADGVIEFQISSRSAVTMRPTATAAQ